MCEVTVDIVCPKCSKKALFHSEYVGGYKRFPNREGKIICKNCGFNGLHFFTNKDYYYQIPVGNRTLFAQTLDNLIFLRNFFHQNYKNKIRGIGSEPEFDYPKLFYEKREEIVKKINSILKNEIGCS